MTEEMRKYLLYITECILENKNIHGGDNWELTEEEQLAILKVITHCFSCKEVSMNQIEFIAQKVNLLVGHEITHTQLLKEYMKEFRTLEWRKTKLNNIEIKS